ncbi:MAG: radical SAM protein [Candidatus Eremiobacteraeota bacterium]|nr:radical SAM protein [Candidatus Eremiobacteraeota bacterium]
MKILREEQNGAILYDDSTFGYLYTADVEMARKAAGRVIDCGGPSHGRSDILLAPIRIYFELTTRCNLACLHCFACSSPSEPEGMEGATVLRLLEDLARSGVINVRFTGGEPTARSDWHEIMAYARSLGLVTSLSTNGVFGDPDDTVRKIAGLSIGQVTVSLDGSEREHDALRGEGTFRQVILTLLKLRERGLQNVRITTVLSKRNLHSLAGITEIAARHAKVLNFVCTRPVGRASHDGGLLLSFDEHYNTAREVLRLRERHSRLLIIHSDLPLPTELASTGSPAYQSTSLCVAADGTIWPHHYTVHQTGRLMLGRFPQDRPVSLWAHSVKLDGFRAWTGALLARCRLCSEMNRRCAGIQFEMELAKVLGHIEENPYCRNREKAPHPWDYIPA